MNADILFKPLDLGDLRLKNRIVPAPMTRGRAGETRIPNGIIMGNCGYSQQEAERRLAKGHADRAAFDRPFISNPDLPARLQNGWPLNSSDDMTYWYTPGPIGYTDHTPCRL